MPFFVAGSLFPISALPVGLTAVAKVLPLTHMLALVRYGLLDRRGTGLHDIWGMTDTTTMAALSLAVVVAYALVLTASPCASSAAQRSADPSGKRGLAGSLTRDYSVTERQRKPGR